jgi:hypothetical protein
VNSSYLAILNHHLVLCAGATYFCLHTIPFLAEIKAIL